MMKEAFIFSRKRLYFFTLVAVCLVLFSSLSRRSADTEYLVITHNNSKANGGPITILDLKTGNAVKPSLQGIGCSGVARNPAASVTELLVYCLGPKESDTLWDVSVPEGVAEPHDFVGSPQERLGVRQHAKILTDSNGGLYFSEGGTGPEGEFLTDSGVIIVNKDGFGKVHISNRTEPYFVYRMVLDEPEQKLWLMSVGNFTDILIDRVDVTTKQVDLSLKIESRIGFDMALNGDDIVISMFRTKEKNDITVIDKYSGEIKQQIKLPVLVDDGYNALGVINWMGMLYVAAVDGLYEFDSQSYDLVRFIKNNPGGRFTFLLGGASGLYAISDYKEVVKVSKDDVYLTETLLENVGGGLTNLYLLNI